MALPFPSFGADNNGRQVMFVGERHDNGEDLRQLAWQMMYIHDQVDAVFLEYYDVGTGPVGPAMGVLRQHLTAAHFNHHPTMAADLGQLVYQCQRYGVRVEGWNIPNLADGVPGIVGRSLQAWNDRAARQLMGRLGTLPGVNRYIIFGGAAHGPLLGRATSLLKKTAIFGGGIPCFKYQGGAFRQYTATAGGHVSAWAP